MIYRHSILFYQFCLPGFATTARCPLVPSLSNAGDLGSTPGWGRSPGGGNGYPLQYSCLENPHGQRSLAGYSLWGRKESDTTEHTHKHYINAWLVGK